MKRRNTLIGLGVAAALVAGVGAFTLTASAQDGGGYGPGMMGGQGWGMMDGYGAGYGSMRGYGPGYRHMHGYGHMRGYGPGYGHMRRWGGGYGPGMMQGIRLRSWLRPRNDGLVARSATAPRTKFLSSIYREPALRIAQSTA